MEEKHQDGESNTPNPEAAAVAEIKTQLEKLQTENARLTGRMEQMTMQQSHQQHQSHAQPAPKQITPEEYKKLFDENPAEAVKMAVRGVVKDEVNPLLENVQSKSEKAKWDDKAERDFPAMISDPEFKRAVKERAAELLTTDRLPSDHPTLLYRAAELAAAKYGKKAAPSQSGGMSGEAPNTTPRDPGGSKFRLPNDFEALSKVFGVEGKSKERLAKKMEENHKAKIERERRRYQ